jgi:hypothetical protein
VSTEPLRVWAGTVPRIDFSDRLARLTLAPPVRGLLDDRHPPEVLDARHRSLRAGYVLTGPAEAEVSILHTQWEWMDRADALAHLRAAEGHGLHTLVFSGDDLEPLMPTASAVLLHPGPTRGVQPHARVLALPFLFTDRAGEHEPRPDGPRPSVAFCGQGANRRLFGAAQAFQRAAVHAKHRIRPRVLPPPLAGHVGLRARALRQLAAHPGVDAHLVIRARYRAGAVTDAERARSEDEFDANLRSATYALCVRGQGNFSARFYEALSFGRIPLYLDTGAVLPFEDEIDWTTRTVWVPPEAHDAVADRLVAAHPDAVADPRRSQAALRELWRDWLSEDGFYSRLPDVVRRTLAATDPPTARPAAAHHPNP